MHVSVLVVSRTAKLLNQLIESLNEAYSGTSSQLQILVSWNGTDEDEQKIKPGRFETLIAQRSLYHFAKNMNSLAVLAAGEYIALLNDDLILDPHSLDAAISVLEQKSDVGLVGGKLRDKQGR
ncbi:glycosyltransferase, partial [uncultured Synechococcus sp.]|uniref:glycosyltransferase n=1 Tax=uncultured Synechococcus sp. TaxID=154535 RepID=UPI0025932D18